MTDWYVGKEGIETGGTTNWVDDAWNSASTLWNNYQNTFSGWVQTNTQAAASGATAGIIIPLALGYIALESGLIDRAIRAIK